MAPRKTTKTAVENAEQAAQLAGIEAEAARQQAEQTSDEIQTDEAENFGAGLAEGIIAYNEHIRFQVALAVWPVFVRDRYDYAPAGDENYAGMAAREAFEYADAFIAQSKKGQGDGE